jgi:tetratricopeptide (TPR) repeat protein
MKYSAVSAFVLIVLAAGASAQSTDARARLDEVQRLSSQRNYAAAIAAFEAIHAQQPEAIASLDGLKMVTVYAEAGDMPKFESLTRWLVQRHREPKTSTDAERSVKGYIVHRSAEDPQLLAHAVDMTRFASEQAAAHGEGEYQGFFDTSRGIALYRVGRFAEAAEWLPKGLDHESLYVRSLALPFYAMTELARGNRTQADALMARARAEAARLPAPGTEEYGVEWTDILITKMVMQEAEDALQSRPMSAGG